MTSEMRAVPLAWGAEAVKAAADLRERAGVSRIDAAHMGLLARARIDKESSLSTNPDRFEAQAPFGAPANGRLQAKVCGLATPQAVEAAIGGGAAYIGFVFFARSPRNVAPEHAARLAEPARAAGVKIVAVTVDAADAELSSIAQALAPDYVQLHGGESPARAGQVRRLTGAGIIKALRIAEPPDLDQAAASLDTADMLMFDAKPPADAVLPGGNGSAFDWRMLSGRRFPKPWFLAGGLDAANVAQASAQSGAALVDVSSGVESRPGCKDPRLIEAFLDAVRRA